MLGGQRERGCVDAGGAGLLELVRGLTAAIAGEPLPEPAPAEELPLEAVHQELSRFRYCTVFVVEREDEPLEPERLEAELDRLGGSRLGGGDSRGLKGHVPTGGPGAAPSAGGGPGAIEAGGVREQSRGD